MDREIGSTTNGIDYCHYSVNGAWSLEELVQYFKQQHGFKEQDQIAFFTEGHEEIKNLEILRTQLFSGILKTLRIAKLNSLRASMELDRRDNSIEEIKGKLNTPCDPDLFDKVARGLYSCPKTECRKTFDDIEKLFTHALIHSQHKKYHCTMSSCNRSFPSAC